jgi:hypothetical protein
MRTGLNKRARVDIFERTALKVYDVTEKKLIGIYASYELCGAALGLEKGRIADIVNRKSRNKTNKLGITICIRRAPE